MMTHFFTSKIKPGALALMVLMAATRFHHFGSTITLPDASLAVFFLAGLWFGGRFLFVALLLEAGLIDYLAISQFNVSDFCISSAYVFLVPTYAAVWMGGRYCRAFSKNSISHLSILFGVLVVSVSIAFLMSNGSFYLLSDKFVATNWLDYSTHFLQYYPSYLQYAVIYSVIIYALKQVLVQIKPLNSPTESAKT